METKTELLLIANTIDSWIEKNPKKTIKDISGKSTTAVLVEEDELAIIRDSILGGRHVHLTNKAAIEQQKRQKEYKTAMKKH